MESKIVDRRSWFEQKERGSVLGMRIIVWVALRLGRSAVRILLMPIVFYYVLFFKGARESSRVFLERINNKPVSFKDIYRHFFTFAQVTVDRLYFLANRLEAFQVNVHNEALLFECLEAGQGCILLMSHFGSFDVIRAMGVRNKDLRAKVLMDKHYAAKAMSLINAINPALSEDIIDVEVPPAQLMLQLQACLNRGEIVGIMADRVHKSERVFSRDFLGNPSDWPAGPWLMAAALKVPVIACFGVYSEIKPAQADRSDKRFVYDVVFEKVKLSLCGSRKERQAWMNEGLGRYIQHLENHARKKPFNWFNFFNFWREDNK